MRKINDYFFGEEEITLSDGLWFYGIIVGIIAIVMITLILG